MRENHRRTNNILGPSTNTNLSQRYAEPFFERSSLFHPSLADPRYEGEDVHRKREKAKQQVKKRMFEQRFKVETGNMVKDLFDTRKRSEAINSGATSRGAPGSGVAESEADGHC